MNLGKKKSLAARTLNVGEGRIVFINSRLDEIKEAITKQDIRDLKNSGAIVIREIKGRRKTKRISKKKRDGNVRIKINVRKKRYVTLTRKLRKYISLMKENGKLSNIEFKNIRRKIRNKEFKSLNDLKAYLGGLR